VIVSDNLNGCSRLICLVLGTAALCDISVRSVVYKSSYLLTYLRWSCCAYVRQLKCCGVDSYLDWAANDNFRANKTVPDSCCVDQSEPGCSGPVLRSNDTTNIYDEVPYYIHYADGRSPLPSADSGVTDRARQLYKNISMLFLFPVKGGKLSTGVNATFNASCYG